MTLTFEEIQGWSAQEAQERLSSSAAETAHIMQVAAQAGMAEAQALYGQILLDGNGVEKDESEALRWFSEAAQQGHVMAMNMVGRCCEHGWGTQSDPSLAAQWYGAAAQRGLDWAMYNLATLHCLGKDVVIDRERAFALFSDAAALGHAKSVTMLGGFHEDGWVVDRDMTRAAELYRQAAERGDFRGEFNHARMLIEANRLDEAEQWLSRLTKSATPAFLAKVIDWLSSRPEPRLRQFAQTLAP